MVDRIDGRTEYAGAPILPPANGGSGASVAVGSDAGSSVRPVSSEPQTPDVAVKDSASIGVGGSYSLLQERKAASNNNAQAVQQLEQVRGAVEQAKKNLTQITKIFPPYPADSSERAKLLEALPGIRKVTEQLTIPPSVDEQLKKLNEQPAVTTPQPSDAQVGEALAALNRVNDTLNLEVKKLFSSDGSTVEAVGAENAAQQQSQTVGAQLGANGAGITNSVTAKRIMAST